jgi:two-component system sensor histidine kinase QseC
VPRAPSIRRRLLWLLLLVLALAWSAAAFLTYLDAHREVDALLDAHLRQSARLLVAQAELDLDEIELDEDDDEYGTDVAFQVRRTDGSVLLRSAKAPAEPFASGTRGFSDVTAGARDWRVYTMLDEHGATVVHFAEDHATRERIAGRMAMRALGPMLALLPVLGFAIWWTVGRSLRPLEQLGDDIARRGADDLAPMSAGLLPAELQPLVRRLDELFLRIRDSLDSERRFTSHAAHELRTPVAALRAQAEVAAGARDPSVREAALAHCIEACDHMTRLVSQLLLLARADELSTLVDMRPCRLDLIAQSVLAVVAPEAGHANVALALDVPGEYTVRGDAALLEALVRNLVDNAVRHGSGEARVTLGADSRGMVLSVEDDGPGVSAEVMSQLGRRFYRAPDARGTGSGLGLSIVARIAQLHQAVLQFQNGPHGRGLRVSVTFPR